MYIVDVFVVAARVAIAAGVMASATFVLGTVVGYQYHSMILKLALGDEVDKTHRRLVRRWYNAGVVVGVAVCIVIDSWHSTSLYLLLLAGLVMLFWMCWWANAARGMRTQIVSLGVGWEFFWSCFSLSVVSAVSGAAMVDQAFKLLGWRQ